MITFFRKNKTVYTVESENPLNITDVAKLKWLFGSAEMADTSEITGNFTGPRREMVTPWSTNAVEITQNMNIKGISRIEEFVEITNSEPVFDPMLSQAYHRLGQDVFTLEKVPEPIRFIENISVYNQQEGLALSSEEIEYLENISRKISRKLTDSEVFGFSQVNSEHCRHKIFNGTFIIDGQTQGNSLFELIKKTSSQNPNFLVSAYKDNVAFIQGPRVEQFAPSRQDHADYFEISDYESVISLKAETHNFPTTVEPFNGAATGSGGEIRDRMAGGKGSIPIAGTAVYMTSYPRLQGNRNWEKPSNERKWLYHPPVDILIRASNGASDFGNKFGQPLICGSLLTFEHAENNKIYGFDKVIMLAGGVGSGKKNEAFKDKPSPGQQIVVMGGDNYRIGMGGGAVSSVSTGEFNNTIELNAVQRSNPEMQKRVANALRAMTEAPVNPIVSVHDHGAGGHLNSISELVEETGGIIHIDQLPVGDPTLSQREIIGNESQERMGLVMDKENLDYLKKVSERERAPMYVCGEVTEDHQLVFKNKDDIQAINLSMEEFFGKPPKTILTDSRSDEKFTDPSLNENLVQEYLEQVLQLESVACKDWLTNKVDRSVTGKIAMQQNCGELHLPLNNLGITTLDYTGTSGIATSLGHAPVAGLADVGRGSRLAVAEALTNLVWAPLTHNLKGVSLSANWMWPAKNPGENARLYEAVTALSDFVSSLGINIPTGKDSLSMTQKYPDGSTVFAPGTVIISAVAEVYDVKKAVSPALKPVIDSPLLYISFSDDQFSLAGSALYQTLNAVGNTPPDSVNADRFVRNFNAMQTLIREDLILGGHDVSAGGLITTLLEMCFPTMNSGLMLDLNCFSGQNLITLLFSEQPGVVIQIKDYHKVVDILNANRVIFHTIGKFVKSGKLAVDYKDHHLEFAIDSLRKTWFNTSWLLEKHQTRETQANLRMKNFDRQNHLFCFPEQFSGHSNPYGAGHHRKHSTGIKAAIIREKGVNGDREMAYSLYYAGFDVKDVHMTDLISGRETLDDIRMIVFVGGFSNSDVLGSAKGWAGAFKYNQKARDALDRFYDRNDTLSLGVCNGCQLMIELNLISSHLKEPPVMRHNESGKFESRFLDVVIPDNNSIMLKSLAGCRLGVWVAHGEGKFELSLHENHYHIPMKFGWHEYPGNPNGSLYDTAALCSEDGRHLAMMPHIERSLFPWQWPYYPTTAKHHETTPWIEAFVNARRWIENSVE